MRKYWNLYEILPFQRKFNFINGKRKCGKTYTLIKWLIKQALEKERIFTLLGRTGKEVDNHLLEEWTEKVRIKEYPDIEFLFKGRKMYKVVRHQILIGIAKDGTEKYDEQIELILIADSMALSERTSIKKRSFPSTYKYLVLEEYMIEDDKKGEYVNGWNEPDLFLSIYDTIDRDEDRVICFLLGNCTKFFNPYHMHRAFNIPRIPKGSIWTNKTCLFQWIDDEQLGNPSSLFNEMVENTSYGKMAVKGEYSDNNNDFIEKRSGLSCFNFAFIYLGETYGVWTDMRKGLIFIDEKWDSTTRLIYSLTLEDHRENTLLTKGRSSAQLKWLARNFKLGNVRYVNHKVRAKCEGAIKLIL